MRWVMSFGPCLMADFERILFPTGQRKNGVARGSIPAKQKRMRVWSVAGPGFVVWEHLLGRLLLRARSAQKGLRVDRQ